MKQGVPQGGMLSPVLLNRYMPLPETDNIEITYADEIALTKPGPNINNLADNMNLYFNSFSTWPTGRKLSPSGDKSTTSIFSIGPMNSI